MSGRGLLAVGVMAFALAAAHGGGGHDATAGCGHLEHLWDRAGGSPAQAQTAASVAMAESGGDPGATDYDANGTVDRGLWQVNSAHGSLSTYDPLGSARAAVAISRDGSDWSPWAAYTSGAYAGRC